LNEFIAAACFDQVLSAKAAAINPVLLLSLSPRIFLAAGTELEYLRTVGAPEIIPINSLWS